MLTRYPVTHDKAMAGQPVGDIRDSRPMTLPWLAQISQIRIADASPNAGEAVTWTFEDDESEIVETLTFNTGASLAATLTAAMAAFNAHAKLPSLYTAAEDATEDFTVTARHPNRTSTIAASVASGSMTFAVSNLQNAGGSGIEFGRMVARASTGDKEFRAVTTGDTLRNLCGILFRTDANHFHSLENDTPSAVDACQRGRTYAIGEEMRVWVEVEENWTPESRVFCRLALTSSAGRIGAFRVSPAGGAEVWTMTPTAAENSFLLLVEATLATGEKQSVVLDAGEPDGSTTATEICDGWRTALTAAQADGLLAGFVGSGTATFILTGPAGVSFRVSQIGEGVVGTVETTPSTVDALDVSDICRFENSGSGTITVPGLAELRVKI